MGFYRDVNKGDKFSPSSGMHNDLVRIINRIDGFRENAITGGGSNSVKIAVFNTTDKTITQGSSAQIDNKSVMCEDAFPIIPYAGASFWGVVDSDILPGNIGGMLVSGCAEVNFSGGSGDCATPDVNSPGKFILGGTGVPVLFVKDGVGIILLGGGGGASGFEYNGYFKIVHLGGRKFAVVNGYKPDDTICGRTDVPGGETVPRFELELTENQNWAFFYLRAKKNGSKYDVVFETSDTFNGPEVMIGFVYADGKVEQYYVGGGTLYFGREWFL